MNYDAITWEDGKDLGIAITAVAKAGNVVSVQQGSLEYAYDFGCDLRYFLTSPFKFQNASFKAYLVERLTRFQVNVSDVIDTVNSLYEKLTFYVDNESDPATSGFIEE